MLRWFLRRQIAAFERTWNYDASYLRELIDADPRAMLAFGKLQAISRYRKDVPPAAYCAAGIVAVMAEDCGPCTQLGIDMAERGGVDPAVLRAIVTRDFKRCPTRWRWPHVLRKRPCGCPRGRRFARRGGTPIRRARADHARLRHVVGAHVSDTEIRDRPWPCLHAAHCRRRNAAGSA